MKKILLLAVIVLVAAGIVAAGIFFSGGGGGSGNPAEPPAGGLPIPGGGTGAPGTGTGSGTGENGAGADGANGGLPTAGLSLVSQALVLDYAVNPQIGLLTIDVTGTVAVATSSDSGTLASANFGSILGAWFSPDGKWLLVRSGDASASRWSLLDVAKKTWRDIVANASEIAWSPTGNQLAYFARRTNGSALTTFSPATNATRTLLTLAAPDLTLRWQDATHILIMDRPTSLVSGNILSFSVNNSSLTTFATNVAGAEVRWGGAKSGGLFFSAGPTGGGLSLVDAAGAIKQNATFLTLPSKCAFGDTPTAATSSPALVNYLFCAIPQDASLMRDHQLPDEYIKKEFGTVDALYAIDLVNRAILPLLPTVPTFSFDAANMKVYGTDLYFLDRNSQKLYRASLETIIGIEAAE